MKATILGYDLKEDVVEHCNAIAQKYGYDGLRPACYLDSDLLIPVDDEDTGIGAQEAGTIVAELVEQFGGTYATGEQFAAEVSFLLGKLRAIREGGNP